MTDLPTLDTGSLYGVIEIEGALTPSEWESLRKALVDREDYLPPGFYEGRWTILPGGIVARVRHQQRVILEVNPHVHDEGVLHWVIEVPSDNDAGSLHVEIAHLAFGPGAVECGAGVRGSSIPLGQPPQASACRDCQRIISAEIGVNT